MQLDQQIAKFFSYNIMLYEILQDKSTIVPVL